MTFATYISIDVAVRSLAVGVYRLNSFRSMDDYKDADVCIMDDNLNSIVNPLLMNVIDINDGEKTKDTSIVNKSIALKQVLIAIDTNIKDLISGDDVRVLIEYQLNANHGANAIFNMIVYHYAGRYPIEVMKPSWKNTIALHPRLALSEFLGRCASNYSANKQHTKFNMLYLLTMIDKMHMIKGIANKNQDDIADTLMQALAFHKKACE